MTEEQAQLLIAIVSKLDDGAIEGEWPKQQCRYCNGSSDGYTDSRSFTHNNSCVVLLIQQLRQTTYDIQ